MISSHCFDLPDLFEPWRLKSIPNFPNGRSKEMWKISAYVQSQIKKLHELITVVENKPSCRRKRKRKKKRKP